ncbi:MAG: hypothetical protein JWO45_1357 [Spartobacteria bacterium]|nr:hypothetical protein [Spartobacteria bacterium]
MAVPICGNRHNEKAEYSGSLQDGVSGADSVLGLQDRKRQFPGMNPLIRQRPPQEAAVSQPLVLEQIGGWEAPLLVRARLTATSPCRRRHKAPDQ